jgi:RNA polymerase sigma-70 factor (ECF subfamily)
MARPITAAEFETLYRATARDVLNYVRRRGCPDVEDLVAEVYAVAWRRRSDLPSPAMQRAWLFGVARTLLKADVRHQQRDGELTRDLAARTAQTANGPAAARTAQVVAAALERLTPNEREILRLVTWEGLTPTELAVVLGVRPGTVRVRLHRARRALASDPEIRTLVDELDPAVPTTAGSTR